LLKQKNVKTIVFSELSKNDKTKYFKFLVENDINFTRDENGCYIALVKVLNPNFYGGELKTVKEKKSRPRFEEPVETREEVIKAKPRSSSQIGRNIKTVNLDKSKPRSRSPNTTIIKIEKNEKKVVKY
jgi:hypothetical protein